MRTIYWFIYFWLYQLRRLPQLFEARRLKEAHDMEAHRALIRQVAPKWASDLLRVAGCRVHVVGAENIPEGAALYVSNHQGAFDIPILLSVIPDIAFVAKDSLEKMPLLSQWMQQINCVFITRNQPKKAVAAITQGARLLKSGQSLSVFPEGTRSRDGQPDTFKPGALKLATKGGVPVVPVVIDGSIHIMKKNSFWIQPATVRVTILPAYTPEEVTALDTVALADELQSKITQHLNAEHSNP